MLPHWCVCLALFVTEELRLLMVLVFLQGERRAALSEPDSALYLTVPPDYLGLQCGSKAEAKKTIFCQYSLLSRSCFE